MQLSPSPPPGAHQEGISAPDCDIGGAFGRLEVGAEADFIALNPQATPLMARRTAATPALSDVLRILLTLGDDRAVDATYILGRQVHGVRQ